MGLTGEFSFRWLVKRMNHRGGRGTDGERDAVGLWTCGKRCGVVDRRRPLAFL